MVWVTHSTHSTSVGTRYFLCSNNFSEALTLFSGANSAGGAGSGSGPFSADTRASIWVSTASALSNWPLLSYQRGDQVGDRGAADADDDGVCLVLAADRGREHLIDVDDGDHGHRR